MKTKSFTFAIKAVCVTVILVLSFAWVHASDDIKVLKIDPDEHAAVLKTGNGRLEVIKQGDEIEPFGQILSISTTRIVFKNKKAEKTILTLTDEKQSIQRVGKINPASQLPVMTITAAGDAGHLFKTKKEEAQKKRSR